MSVLLGLECKYFNRTRVRVFDQNESVSVLLGLDYECFIITRV